MRALILAITLLACDTPRQERLAVDVFSEDTVPARFTLSMSGGLELRVNAERSYMLPDRSVVFETPASLYVHKGEGVGIVRSEDSTRRIAVQPQGLPPDSAQRAAVVGAAIRITREPGRAALTLGVERP